MQLINRFIWTMQPKPPADQTKLFSVFSGEQSYCSHIRFMELWIGIDSYANCLNAKQKISSFLYYPLTFFVWITLFGKSVKMVSYSYYMFYYMPENIMRRSFCLGYFCVHSEFEQFLSLWWSNKKRTIIIWEGFRSLPLEKTMNFQKRLLFVGRSSNVAASAAVYSGKATKMNQE